LSEIQRDPPQPGAVQVVPTVEVVRGWLTSLSNWGRWGADDDLGTLNYIGVAERAAALTLVTGEETVSCAAPITFGRTPHSSSGPPASGPHPAWQRPQRFIIQDGTESASSSTRISGYDAFLIAPHGPNVTHLDAPRHTVLNGSCYNGIPAGAPGSRGTIESVSAGIVGRGVLLDVADVRGVPWLEDGEPVFPDDLERCEVATGTRIRTGDIIFVRTGYRKRLPNGPTVRFAHRPGLHASCLPWLHEREVAVVACDVATDVVPHDYGELGLPVHTVGMWAMGLWLLDNCNLEALAPACRDRSRWAFLAAIAPLDLADGTGSPVNPIAIF
jgi:kynurenine formamidase